MRSLEILRALVVISLIGVFAVHASAQRPPKPFKAIGPGVSPPPKSTNAGLLKLASGSSEHALVWKQILNAQVPSIAIP